MDYLAPTDLNEALQALAAEPRIVVAGATDYFPSRCEKSRTESLLDVTRIAGLRGVSIEGDNIRIGATTRWTDVVRADLPACCNGLKAAALEVGSIQIQNAGTVAGNLCNASPAADGVPPLLTLDAEVELASTTGTRQLPLPEFLQGVRQTALSPGELVTAIHIPLPPAHTGSAFEKLGSRKYLVISITMVAALIGCDPEGHIDVARIAVGACSPVAQRLPALEAALIGTRPHEVTVTASHLSPLSPIDDVRGEAEYRLVAVAEQIRRAVMKAASHG